MKILDFFVERILILLVKPIEKHIVLALFLAMFFESDEHEKTKEKRKNIF